VRSGKQAAVVSGTLSRKRIRKQSYGKKTVMSIPPDGKNANGNETFRIREKSDIIADRLKKSDSGKGRYGTAAA
jgi:hypothetical protein